MSRHVHWQYLIALRLLSFGDHIFSDLHFWVSGACFGFAIHDMSVDNQDLTQRMCHCVTVSYVWQPVSVLYFDSTQSTKTQDPCALVCDPRSMWAWLQPPICVRQMSMTPGKIIVFLVEEPGGPNWEHHRRWHVPILIQRATRRFGKRSSDSKSTLQSSKSMTQ